MFASPSTAAVEAATPPDRDRAIDLLRIFSLFVVIVGHLLLVVLYFDARCPTQRQCLRTAGSLDDSVALQWLTWGLQVMPLFFFAGGAGSAGSYKPGDTWGGWLLKRCQRLYRPVFWFLAVMAGLIVVCRQLVPADAMAVAEPQALVLLWFLGVYTVCLACVPLLGRISTGPQLALAVAALYVLTALVDTRRWAELADAPGSPERIGQVNFMLVWLIPVTLGVGYRKGLVPRPVGALMFALALAVDLSLRFVGPYATSLLGLNDTAHIPNATPPSLLLAGHAIALCGLAVLFAPQLRRLAAVPQVWRWAAIGNAGAMTLYLWHWLVLFGMYGGLIVAGQLPTSPGSPGLWPEKAQQLPLFLALVLVAFLLLRPLEARPLPWWDVPAPAAGWRSPVVGTLLCCSGVAVLSLSALGLTEGGLRVGAALLVLLATARALAGPDRR